MSRGVSVVLLVVLAGLAAALPRDIARREQQKRQSTVTSPPNNCALIQCDIPLCETEIIYPDRSTGKCCPYCAESCDSFECGNGTTCQIFPNTGEAYCDPDCSADNGGCEADQQCVQALALCSSDAQSPCLSSVTCVDPNLCPDGSQPVNCFANPCDITACPNHPNATCEEDYCGGCNAFFFDSDGNEVTKTCQPVVENPCDSFECDKGEACRIFFRTGKPYCDPDCSVDNGGCEPNQICIQALALCSINSLSPCPGAVACVDNNTKSCPDGSEPVLCFVNPCDVTKCPNYPNATCEADYCGGCNAFFFDSNGNEVTKTCRSPDDKPDCSAVLCLKPDCDNPLPPPPGKCCYSCPSTIPTAAICELDPDEGPCEALIEQYFYNSTSEACEVFFYGGCEGNENRFSSLGDCEKRCPANESTENFVDCRAVRCAAPSCPDPILADPANGKCCDTCPEGSSCPYDGQFYQGCGSRCLATCTDPFPPCVLVCSPGCHCPTGQVVNEKTGSCVPLEECPVNCNLVDCAVPSCQDPIPADPANGICCSTCPESDEPTDICQLPAKVGNCRARIKRYYFNSESGKCESFFYGGCNGNKNNFQSLKDCREECEPTEKPPVDCSVALCPDIACPNPIPANPANGQCCNTCPPGSSCPVKGQIYSQCKACEVTCADQGQLIPCPAVCGPGCQCPQGQVIDEESNTCVLPEQCPELDTCKLNPDVGICKAAFLRYFYNTTSERCERFVYGGCRGNENNFESLASCERKCSECAPTCSPDFCKGNRRAKCSIPEEAPGDGGCFGDCDETICSACYYSNETVSMPTLDEDCPNLCPVDAKGEIFGMTCLRKWGKCVRNAYKTTYGKPSQELKVAENFKCWRPKCPQAGDD